MSIQYLVKDRVEVTGARWGPKGAEAVLELRALRKNGDWPRYWRFHLAQERKRVHESRYLDKVIPTAARTSLRGNCTRRSQGVPHGGWTLVAQVQEDQGVGALNRRSPAR